MKHQALFCPKDKSEKKVKKIIKCRLLQFLFGALRVKLPTQYFTFPSKILLKPDNSHIKYTQLVPRFGSNQCEER